MDTVSDGKGTENNETPLETKMQFLEINEAASCSTAASPDSSRKRTLRTRIPLINKIEGKRRVTIKPKKRLNSGSKTTTTDISQVYLSKKFKRVSPNLETIFEEPKLNKSNEMSFTENKKKRRFLLFEQSNQLKVKKRQQKVKKLFGKSVFKKKRSSMDLLLQKLCNVE